MTADVPTFEMTTVGLTARGRPEPEGGFTVLAGSQARVGVVDSYERVVPPGYRKRRAELIESGVLRPDGEALRFTEDVPFRSSTEAACVVAGRMAGVDWWRNPRGKAYRKWLQEQATEPFPFERFCADAERYAQEYAQNPVEGNGLLDEAYAPHLLERMQGDWRMLRPQRFFPYTTQRQMAVKLTLAGGVKSSEGVFARALLYAEDATMEYVVVPPGLTLEVGVPDGRDDRPHRALRSPEARAALAQTLNMPLPKGLQATLTLNTTFGPLQLQPLGPDQADAAVELTLARYAGGTPDRHSRRLRVGLSFTPEQIVSPTFSETLGVALNYADAVAEALGELTPSDGPGPVQPGPGRRPPRNQILYGPPGTGKTYGVLERALEILDPELLASQPGRELLKERYDALVQGGQISFVTFHQSFGYEDFVEGLRPEVRGSQLHYAVHEGIFLQAARAAGWQPPEEALGLAPTQDEGQPGPAVWRVYMDGSAPHSQLRDWALEHGELRLAGTAGSLDDLAADSLSPSQLLFRDAMRPGDLVLLGVGPDRAVAAGVVAGPYRHVPGDGPTFAARHVHARKVNWQARGLEFSPQDRIGRQFSLQEVEHLRGVSPDRLREWLGLDVPAAATAPAEPRPHVLIIDEINRGNVSKILGELITLLEDGKRAGQPEALSAQLPLSRKTLSVPQDLYVIGTMNTADRSLSALDTALRRRFEFTAVWPQPELLGTLTLEEGELNLAAMLRAMNDRIEGLLGREQVLGHAYLMDAQTLEDVARALRERILPQLEEHFFDDWDRVREVLGDDRKEGDLQFVQREEAGGRVRYRVNEDAFTRLAAFTGLYGA